MKSFDATNYRPSLIDKSEANAVHECVRGAAHALAEKLDELFAGEFRKTFERDVVLSDLTETLAAIRDALTLRENGLFLTLLQTHALFDGDKYLAGFQVGPTEPPSDELRVLDHLRFRETKTHAPHFRASHSTR